MPEPIDAKTFFEIGVPAALEANKDTAKATAKTIVFHIVGKGGGRWLIDFAKLQSKAGEMQNPDLYVEMNVKDFSDLMDGTISGDDAASSGKMRAKGNSELLGLLGGMLAGAMSK